MQSNDMTQPEKVSREALRQIPIGATAIFTAETPLAVESARVAASRTGKELGCRFKVTDDSDNKQVIIVREML